MHSPPSRPSAESAMAELRYFACGDTTHELSALFAGRVRGRRAFPAGVFLYDNGAGARVLFDTGYRTGPWPRGIAATAYRALVPPRVEPHEGAAEQLAAAGVAPDSITHVVLSHLHPDHVGGLVDFPAARVVLKEETARAASSPHPSHGVLGALLPERFPPRDALVLDSGAFRPTAVGGRTLLAHDLLGDGMYLVLDLPGHAPGHLGALVESRSLLAGDAAWGGDLTHSRVRLRRPLRALNHDWESHLETQRTLEEVAAAGTAVVYSHDIDVPARLW